MRIENIADLKKLIALCRKTGVITIEVDGIKLTLGSQQPTISNIAPELPDYSNDIPEAKMKVPAYNPQTGVVETIETDALTPDELLFYSASGQTEQADA